MGNCFYLPLCSRPAGRSAQTYEKQSCLSIFGPYGPFPQDFAQVRARIMPYLIEIFNVSCIFAWEEGGGVLRFKKKWSFLSIFGHSDHFPHVFRQRRAWKG